MSLLRIVILRVSVPRVRFSILAMLFLGPVYATNGLAHAAALVVSERTPVCETWWFCTAILSALVGLFALLYFLRVRHLTAFNRELEKAYLDLRKAENNYKEIFDNALDGIFQLTPQCALQSANPAAAAIMGYASPAEMQQEITNVLDHALLSDHARRQLLLCLEKEGAVINYELRARRKNQDIIWLTVNLRMVRSDTGKMKYLEGLMEDITARKKTAEQLQLYREHLEQLVDERTEEYQQANLELQKEILERERVEEDLLRSRKLESIGVLAGGIAHDFNNLMTIVMGNINLVQFKRGQDCESELRDAVHALQRARALTQKFITFSSGGDPVKRVVGIEAVTRSAVELALSGSNVQAVFSVDSGVNRVNIDQSQISQALYNVIENSKQAMKEGGSLKVTISNLDVDGVKKREEWPIEQREYVLVEFEDSGGGILPEHLPLVFDPYFTTAGMGSQHGKGLGLTIAYSIVKKHGGYILIDSKLGQGTQVRVLLPAVVEHRPAQTRTDGIRAVRGARVLVMDDEEMLLAMAKNLLTRMGHEVALAPDGPTAINLQKQALATGKPFQVAILDLTIPGGVGGREVVKILRQQDPHLKAIVSSGYAGDPAIADFSSYGFVDTLLKPYTIQALQDVLDKTISMDGA